MSWKDVVIKVCTLVLIGLVVASLWYLVVLGKMSSDVYQSIVVAVLTGGGVHFIHAARFQGGTQ